MRPVILVTDFGARGVYPGMMHAAVHAVAPGVTVVDLLHDVPPQDVAAGAFVLAMAMPFLPADAVIAAVVDPGVGGERAAVVARVGGRHVVAPDNGLASEAAELHGLDAVWEIDRERVASVRALPAAGRTFDGRDVFAPVAASIAAGADPGRFGPRRGRAELAAPDPAPPALRREGARLVAPGRWIDPFGNVLTAAREADVREAFGEAPVGARVRGRTVALADHYAAHAAGEMIVVRNSFDRYEIAVVGGSAAARLALVRAADASIEFVEASS